MKKCIQKTFSALSVLLCNTTDRQTDRQTDKLDDEWPESIFHHVGSQRASYLLSVQCEVLSRVS